MVKYLVEQFIWSQKQNKHKNNENMQSEKIHKLYLAKLLKIETYISLLFFLISRMKKTHTRTQQKY